MKTPTLITFACIFAFISANAQITGSYKISKESPDALIEEFEFNADGTIDIVQVYRAIKIEGSIKRFERATKEVRLECKALIDKSFDEHIEKCKKNEGLKDSELLKKLIRFRELGYNKFAAFVIKSETGGLDYPVVLVGKGDEFLDFDKGFIFKKRGWF